MISNNPVVIQKKELWGNAVSGLDYGQYRKPVYGMYGERKFVPEVRNCRYRKGYGYYGERIGF